MSNSTTAKNDSTSTPWLFVAILAVLVIIGAVVLSVILTRGSSGASGTDVEVMEGSKADSAQTGTVSIAGDNLPTFDAAIADPAVGLPAPVVSATTFGGRAVKVGGDGKGRLISFFAHWCPHCQRELPVYVDWMAENQLPDNVEIVAVSTSVDRGKPNYPPYSWFVREGYQGLVVRDDPGNSFALAYGLAGYPYAVAVDPDGNVVERISGELTPEQISGLIEKAAG